MLCYGMLFCVASCYASSGCAMFCYVMVRCVVHVYNVRADMYANMHTFTQVMCVAVYI